MFEMLALTGGFWFFLFVMFILVVGVVSTEIDSFFGGAITLIFLAAGSQFLFGYPVWASIVANPLLVVVGVVAYVAVGIVYGVYFRYADFLRKRADNIKQSWDSFKKKNANATHDDFRNAYEYKDYTPSANSDKIIAWVMLWPWGVFWDLCHKPIRWVYNNMYSFTGQLLDRVGAKISDRILNEKK